MLRFRASLLPPFVISIYAPVSHSEAIGFLAHRGFLVTSDGERFKLGKSFNEPEQHEPATGN
jgi:hypothetical protein